MYRHELRFVLRFGQAAEFHRLATALAEEESARGWTTPRIWQAVSGRVNEVVIEHDFESADVFRRERDAFHREPGRVGEVLARMSDLAVPGTAEQHDLAGILPASAH